MKDQIKFALDLKQHFERDDKSAKFTLGGYGAYFKERDKDKIFNFLTINIQDIIV
jgi:hypothetical protein